MAPRKKRAEQKKDKVAIFISYAREDEFLAKSIESELHRVFPFTIDVISSMDFKQGENWREAINHGLDKSDILIVLFTSQQKSSHSFTGFEVGYFVRSIGQKPMIQEDLKTLIIPFCIGQPFPDTTEYFQGVQIDPSEVLKLVEDVRLFQNKTLLSEKLDDSNPVLQLMLRLSEVITLVTGTGADPTALQANIRESAHRLFANIYSYLEGAGLPGELPRTKGGHPLRSSSCQCRWASSTAVG